MKSKTTIGAFRRKADYKYDYFYKLWEFHANLLWSRVQYLIVIVVGIYTGWFLLFQKFIDGTAYDLVYFILAELLCLFGTVVCNCFLELAKRDIEHQEYFEKNCLCYLAISKAIKLISKNEDVISLHIY